MARRDQFLAGAAFALDEHGDVLRRHAADRLINRLHRRGAADERIDVGRQPPLIERHGDFVEPAQLQSALGGIDQHSQLNRLYQIVERSLLRRLDRRLCG